MKNPFRSRKKDKPELRKQKHWHHQDVEQMLSPVLQPFRGALFSIHRGEAQTGCDGSLHQLDENTRISVEQGLLIHDLIIERGAKRTLEIGMAYGFSTLYMLAALAANGRGIHTAIDPFQKSDWGGVGLTRAIELAPQFEAQDSFRFIEDRSDRVAADFARAGSRFDLIFIDGNHRFDDVLVDFYLYAQVCALGGLIIFDDMWMPSIRTVVAYIRANREDFKELNSPVGNISIFEKVTEDQRDWRHFHAFEVAGDEL